MQIQPFGEKIAVKILKEEEMTLGGLITVSFNDNSHKGEVVALGEEVKDYIKVGDTVIFNQGAGVSYKDNDAEYKILNIRDVLGKVI